VSSEGVFGATSSLGCDMRRVDRARLNAPLGCQKEGGQFCCC
jgi:hypothetical protein